jgi:hypothetical protein
MLNLSKNSYQMFNYESKLVDSSRMIAEILTADIANEQERFDEMFELALLDKYPISMRAARIVTLCHYKNRKLILPHLYKILESVETTKVDGVKRSFLKILSETPLPPDENFQVRLVDLSFSFVQNNKEAIAVRAFSIDILIKLSKTYPDLKSELIPMLQNMVEDSSKGLQSKCSKILRKMKKL